MANPKNHNRSVVQKKQGIYHVDRKEKNLSKIVCLLLDDPPAVEKPETNENQKHMHHEGNLENKQWKVTRDMRKYKAHTPIINNSSLTEKLIKSPSQVESQGVGFHEQGGGGGRRGHLYHKRQEGKTKHPRCV